MWEASHRDRSSMPAGMWCSQLSIGSPKTRTFTPAWSKCAAAESPYGPAPTTTTEQRAISDVIRALDGATLSARIVDELVLHLGTASSFRFSFIGFLLLARLLDLVRSSVTFCDELQGYRGTSHGLDVS